MVTNLTYINPTQFSSSISNTQIDNKLFENIFQNIDEEIFNNKKQLMLDYSKNKKQNTKSTRNMMLIPMNLAKNLSNTNISSVSLCESASLLSKYKTSLTDRQWDKVIEGLIKKEDMFFCFNKSEIDYIPVLIACFGNTINIHFKNGEDIIVSKIKKENKINFLMFLCQKDIEAFKALLINFSKNSCTFKNFILSLMFQKLEKIEMESEISKSLFKQFDKCIIQTISDVLKKNQQSEINTLSQIFRDSKEDSDSCSEKEKHIRNRILDSFNQYIEELKNK